MVIRKMQPIDIIESYNYQYGFCLGSVIKYVMRINYDTPKGENSKDIAKAIWYLEWVLEHTEADWISCNKGIPFVQIRHEWKDILPAASLGVLKHLTKVHNKRWLIPKYYLKTWNIKRAIAELHALQLSIGIVNET